MKPEHAIGLPLDRVDGRLKVTGKAKYSAEFRLPGQVVAELIQSTIASGTVKSVDTAAAKAAPGVLSVLTVMDGRKFPNGQPVFGTTEVKYSGQHLGFVIAETIEQAKYAAGLVKIEYDVTKPVASMEAHLADAFPAGGGRTSSKRGDFATEVKGAAETLHQVYRTPIEHHNPMEPHATTAVWEGDQLTLHESTQGIFGTQGTVAKLFSTPNANVRVVAYFIGGGFGCKGQTWPHTSITAFAAKEVGRPVRLELERRQMFSSNGYRPTTRQEITLGTDPKGKLVALQQSAHTSSSPAGDFAEPVGSVPSFLYSCANVDISQKLVRLNTGMPTYMRAPGESSGSFGTESAMDEMAIQLGMDPLEFRLRNYAEIDESRGQPYSSKSLRECYAKASEAFGWSRRNPKPRSVRKGNVLVGYGMATATYPANAGPSTANIRIFADGSVLVLCGTQDIGTGTFTILGQVAAENLGVPVQRVRTEIGDTNFPPGPHSGGSSTASGAGSSVQIAADGLKKILIGMAVADAKSPLFGVKPEDVVASDGRLSLIGSSRSESYADLIKRSGQPMVEHKASGQVPAKPGQQQYSKHGFGAHFSEVHVDEDLGMVRVVRHVSAFATGKILNAKTAKNQFLGGIIWGISMALLEESMLDPNYARYVNSNLAEYHVPTNADIPDVEVIMVPEVDIHVNPIGTKGIGEIGIVGSGAAVANAVYNATGKRIRDLPITLDKLL